MHKSALFSILNTNPTSVSKDRLTRVKSKFQTNQKSKVIEPESLSLFDEVAVHVKEKGKPPCFKIGRVIRMRNHTQGFLEYRKPICLADAKKYPNVILLLNLYFPDEDFYVYAAAVDQSVEYKLEDIIMKVNLSIQDDGKYSLNARDYHSLKEFLQNVAQKRKGRNNISLNTSSNEKQMGSADGKVVLYMESQGSSCSGKEVNRRSQRKQRVIVYEAT